MATSQAVLELLVKLKDEASSGLDSIGSSIGSLGAIAGGVALAGVAAFGATLASGVADAREAAKVYAQTEQVIKSTGGAAGFSAQQIADMASSLSAASGQSLFGDDDIERGQNMLLTFTNIKETLPDTTKTMLDMAQALGTDAGGAAVQLGKALNDPIHGITALTRVGVTFTDEQKKQIKTLQEAGDMAGAQRVILAELNKEFGGSALAAAKADGGWAQFNDRLGEAKEAMGTAVLPLLSRLGAFLNDTIAPAVESAAAAFSAWLSDPATVATIDAITNAIAGGLGAAFAYLSGTVLPAVVEVFQSQILPVLSVVVGWLQGALPRALAFVNEHWDAFKGALIAIGAVLAGAAIVGTLASLAATIATLASPIGLIVAAVALLGAAWSENWGGIRDTLTAFWTGTAQPILADLVTWLSETIPPAIQELAAFWTGTLQPALQQVWAFIQQNIFPVLSTLVTVYIAAAKVELQALASFWTNVLLPALNEVWSFLNSYIIPIISALVNVNIAVLKKEIELLSALWSNVLFPALNQVWSFIQANIIPIFDDTNTKATGLSATIRETLGPAFDWLGDHVLGPVKGFFDDIGRAIQSVIKYANDLASTINSIQIPDWLQGHSPPPMANWFSNIADAAQRAQEAANGFAIPGSPGGGFGFAGATSAFRADDSGGGGTAVFHAGAVQINNLPQTANARQVADIVIDQIDRRMRSKK